MKIIQIRNCGIRPLPHAWRTRRWVEVGCIVFIAEGRQRLEVGSEKQDDDDVRTLLLVLSTASSRYEVRNPENLSAFTTEALVRAVEYDERGVTRVLLDLGELVTAPAVAVMP